MSCLFRWRRRRPGVDARGARQRPERGFRDLEHEDHNRSIGHHGHVGSKRRKLRPVACRGHLQRRGRHRRDGQRECTGRTAAVSLTTDAGPDRSCSASATTGMAPCRERSATTRRWCTSTSVAPTTRSGSNNSTIPFPGGPCSSTTRRQPITSGTSRRWRSCRPERRSPSSRGRRRQISSSARRSGRRS